VALVNRRDENHEAAIRATQGLSDCILVTAEAVLMEFLNFASIHSHFSPDFPDENYSSCIMRHRLTA
jgi:hypothetical protein